MKVQTSRQLLACGLLLLSWLEAAPSAEQSQPAGVVPAMAASTADAAREKGRKIVAEAFQLLSSNLQTAIQHGGISNALPYCSAAALPLTRTIAEKEGVTVRRFTHRPRNPQGKADPLELSILTQFRQAMVGTNPPNPVVTNAAPGKVTFFAPIVLNQPLCLSCHGEPGKDIRPEHVGLINRLYPGDQAKGFKVGELRGGWRVDFPLASLESPGQK